MKIIIVIVAINILVGCMSAPLFAPRDYHTIEDCERAYKVDYILKALKVE